MLKNIFNKMSEDIKIKVDLANIIGEAKDNQKIDSMKFVDTIIESYFEITKNFT
jgi:hypothetical protein